MHLLPCGGAAGCAQSAASCWQVCSSLERLPPLSPARRRVPCRAPLLRSGPPPRLAQQRRPVGWGWQPAGKCGRLSRSAQPAADRAGRAAGDMRVPPPARAVGRHSAARARALAQAAWVLQAADPSRAPACGMQASGLPACRPTSPCTLSSLSAATTWSRAGAKARGAVREACQVGRGVECSRTIGRERRHCLAAPPQDGCPAHSPASRARCPSRSLLPRACAPSRSAAGQSRPTCAR